MFVFSPDQPTKDLELQCREMTTSLSQLSLGGSCASLSSLDNKCRAQSSVKNQHPSSQSSLDGKGQGDTGPPPNPARLEAQGGREGAVGGEGLCGGQVNVNDNSDCLVAVASNAGLCAGIKYLFCILSCKLDVFV